MGEIKINENICCIEASFDPLSADIGIIRESGAVWLFDVGNGSFSLEELKKKLSGNEKVNVALSHFHADHTGNIAEVSADEIYASKETIRHIGRGNIITEDTYFGQLHVFPLPSSHCKGSIGLEIGEYVFVGDALYCRAKDDVCIYNAQLLKEEIRLLKTLRADKVIQSHFKGLIRRKDDVIAELEEIYRLRKANDPEIRFKEDE